MNIKQVIQRHALVSFFAFAYGITWGGLTLFFASKGFRADAIQLTDIAVMLLIMLLGPSVSGVGLTLWLDGRRGLSELFSRMRVWRVGIGWYAVALLTIPLLTLAILSVMTITISQAFAPGFLLFGLAIGLLAGIFEELGWTGFALPCLLNKHNALTAGFFLGLLWAIWHGFADYIGNINTMGQGWFPHYFVYWLLPLIAYRILMTWVYVNTKSLLLAQLMHASYTGWQIVLSPTTTFENNMLWQGVFAAGVWIIVAVVVAVSGTNLVRRRFVQAARPV